MRVHSSDPNFSKIIDLVAGAAGADADYDAYVQKHMASARPVKISWERALCSHLLYRFAPQISLKTALGQFMGNKTCRNLTKVDGSNEDLLCVLLRMYICVEGHSDATERLRTFKNVRVTRETSKTQEFHVQWLV